MADDFTPDDFAADDFQPEESAPLRLDPEGRVMDAAGVQVGTAESLGVHPAGGKGWSTKPREVAAQLVTFDGRVVLSPEQSTGKASAGLAHLKQDALSNLVAGTNTGGYSMAGPLAGLGAAQMDPFHPVAAYRKGRDAVESTTRPAMRETGMLPKAIGGLPAALLTGGGSTVAARLVATAIEGAVGAFGASEGDLTQGEVGRVATDTGLGAAVGLGAGVAGEGVAQIGKRAGPYLLGRSLERGAQVLQGNSTLRAASKKPLSEAAVRQALDTGVIKAGGSTPQALEALQAQAAEYGALYGQILDELETAGVRGSSADQLAREFAQRFWKAYANTGADKAAANVYRREAGNAMDLAEAGGGTLGLRQQENIKRSLQDQGQFDLLMPSAKKEALQESSRIFRAGNEDSIALAGAAAPVGSDVKRAATAFEPVKRQLGRTLEAREAALRAASKEAQKGAGSPEALLKAAALSQTNPGEAAAAIASMMTKRRLPSTDAALSYRASFPASKYGPALGELGRGVAISEQPTYLDALLTYLRSKENQP